ncbi:MAG: hypothetical protein EBZ59_00770 [Planctomycetia bacterium]|nr:hypothetical protein [Planctomycetia bacterium]
MGGDLPMRRPAWGPSTAVVAAVVAATFAGMAAPMRHEVVGVSMAPGLLPGDVVASGMLPALDRWRRPRRFDRWLFTAPDGTPAVKRLVGLPGERVSIDDGDVLVDGERTPSPPGTLAGSAVAVAAAPGGGTGGASGWTGDTPAWRRTATGQWAWGPADRAIGWLRYRHRVGDAGGGRDAACRQVDSPILDDAPFAPEERRRLLPLRDFGLAAVIRPEDGATAGSVRLLMRVGDEHGARTVAAPIDGRRRLACVAGRLDRHLVAAAWVLPMATEPAAVPRSSLPPLPPGRWSIAEPWPPVPADDAAFPLPILDLGVEVTPFPDNARGRDATRLTVERLVVWRDILHLPPADGTAAWTLGDRDLFLLGDFPPGSRDCRHWGPLDVGCLRHRVAGSAGTFRPEGIRDEARSD